MPCWLSSLTEFEDRAPGLRVDADGRLVHEEQPRLVQQPDADVDAPLHPARVGLDALLGLVGQPDLFQHFVDARARAPCPPSPYIWPQKTRFSRAVRSS